MLQERTPRFRFKESRARGPRGSHIKAKEMCFKRRRKLSLALKTLKIPTPFIRSSSTDPQSDVARARSWAAICVQDFDAPCVLQFAWISALCCALHRSTSQVIHRSGSYNIFVPKSTFIRLSVTRTSGEKEYRANVLDCFW